MNCLVKAVNVDEDILTIIHTCLRLMLAKSLPIHRMNDNCSHPVNSDVGVRGVVVERGSLSEVFSKLVLPDIKAGQLPANVVHLLCLQWGHILLHHH